MYQIIVKESYANSAILAVESKHTENTNTTNIITSTSSKSKNRCRPWAGVERA